MSRRNPNTNHSAETAPQTPELSAEMSRDDLQAYFGAQASRAEAMAVALGRSADDWSGEGTFFTSGTVLHELMDRVENDPTYTPSETDVLLARYIDADLKESAAYHSIDTDAVLSEQRGDSSSADEAILDYMKSVKEELIGHNERLTHVLEKNERLEPTTPVPYKAEVRDLSKRDTKKLKGKRIENSKIIGDISGADRVLGNDDFKMNAQTFMELIEEHSQGAVDDETFEQAKAELAVNTMSLDRAADAYMLIVGDESHDFKRHDFIDALDLEDDKNRQKVINEQRRALENEDPLLDSSDVPLNPPVSRDTPQDHTNTNPPVDSRNTGREGAREAAQNHNALTLEAAQARYAATLDDVARSGAKRGGMLFRRAEMDESESYLHDRLDVAIRDLMLLEKPEYVNNPHLELDQRSALINAYYIEKRSALSAKTAEHMAETGLGKFSKFVTKHKTAIGIGATVFGGVLGGGIGGAIAGKAAATAITKFAKKSEANREAISKATFSSGESLRFMDDYLAQRIENGQDIDYRHLVGAASINLRGQFEKTIVKARRKGILGAAATGAAWGGLVWAGGHILIDGGDYLWNGDGGVMDKLNHLDNPNGATPWQPSAEKPWWMNGITPYAIGVGGAAALAFKKALGDYNKQPAQRDYDLAR